VNKKLLIPTLVFLSVAFSASIVAPAFAEIKYVEHIKIIGKSITVIIPEVTPATGIRFDFVHFDGGSHGIRDSLVVYLFSDRTQRWTMTATFPDTDEGFAYASEVYGSPSLKVEQLEPNEIQVRGTTNVIARWSIPLVSPAVPSQGLPEITIPPGHITLNQYGDASSGTTVVPRPFPSGFRFRVDWNSYAAEGQFVCPEWHYNGQVFGEINLDTTQTATLP